MARSFGRRTRRPAAAASSSARRRAIVSSSVGATPASNAACKRAVGRRGVESRRSVKVGGWREGVGWSAEVAGEK
eukprot:358975-Chlamydomonas_euryale.AAC.1